MSAHSPFQFFKPTAAPGAALSALTAHAGAGDTPGTTTAPPTVQPSRARGQVQPLVVSPRGAACMLPDHTPEACARAFQIGAEYIERDVVATQDGVWLLHNTPNITSTINVASMPQFASKCTARKFDGVNETGWFTSDFTRAEIKTPGAVITDAERAKAFSGLHNIRTSQQTVDLVKAHRTATAHEVGIDPATKHPTFHRQLGLGLEGRLISSNNAFDGNNQ